MTFSCIVVFVRLVGSAFSYVICLFLCSGQNLETSIENFDATNADHADSDLIAWSVAYAVVGTQVIVFNTLTLCIFIKTRSLRTREHVMVINLAVADLLFGAFVPILLVYILKPTITLYYVGQILTTFSKIASLITLVVIAVERMHAVIGPI